MSARTVQTIERRLPQSSGLPRLLAAIHADRAVSFEEHLARHGPIPARRRESLLGLVEASGLRGRGGAGFPTAQKLSAVAAQHGRPVVVVNATEGEPVSGKDKVLLRHVPHLVLDGAVAAASALGARTAIVAVADGATAERAALVAAIRARARRRADGRVSLRIVAAPDGFVTGEETALVNHLNGGPPKPTLKPPLPYESGVGGAPTLIQNAETFAHLALISRYGPEWFREIGSPEEPGSALITISGAVRRPGVHEVALGTRLGEVVACAGGPRETTGAYLVGGYFGTWIAADRADRLALSEAGLRSAGGTLGAGSVVVLPASACGVAETARVARYLADESAGQCGPCVHGLAAIADALERLARLDRGDARSQLERWVEQVRGRGACRHPDGAARFVASALGVFADEVEQHLRRGRCSGRAGHVLPLPRRPA